MHGWFNVAAKEEAKEREDFIPNFAGVASGRNDAAVTFIGSTILVGKG